MSDLISRQVAIDDLHGKDPSQIWDTTDIEVWINTFPSAQPERWIPCSERLPIIENNIGARVLITTSWGLVNEAYYCVDHWEINDMTYKLTSVIAWMPLPEPYKGEQE